MKHIALFLAVSIVLTFSACKKDDGAGKKAQLEDLKKQSAEIKSKISALEKELASKGDTSKANEGKIKEVVGVNVGIKPFKHYVEVQGRVDSDKNILVSAEAGGVITKVNVTTGKMVKKGQVLAEIDASVLAQGIEEIKTQIAFANTVYEKQKRLWDQKIGTEIQYLTAKNNKESMEHKLASLQRQFNMTRVKSPIDGTVDEVKFNQGESVGPGTPMFRVVNLSDFKVVADIAEAYQHEINIGNVAEVLLPDAGEEIKSKVTDKSNVISDMNRTFQIEIALKGGASKALRPNMIAKVKINDYSNNKAIVVPVNTVQESEQGNYVYLAEKSGNAYKAKKQFVKKGKSYVESVEILEGLKPEDVLITTGYQDLTDGQLVKM